MVQVNSAPRLGASEIRNLHKECRKDALAIGIEIDVVP
jgi:hypothetical protein